MTYTSRADVAAWEDAGEVSGFRLIGHHDLAGNGDGMQVAKNGNYLSVAHVGSSAAALSVLDCKDPARPRLVHQTSHAPNTHHHKVQVADGLLLQNSEFPHFGDRTHHDEVVKGMSIFDLSDPELPRQIGLHRTGGDGAHRLWFDGGQYAHIAASRPGRDGRGYQIVDLSDPTRPELTGEWDLPGLHDEAERWPVVREGGWYEVHAATPSGPWAYVASEDAGLAILDISLPARPQLISHLDFGPSSGGMVHTCLPLPGRQLVVVTEERLFGQLERPGVDKRTWVVDVSSIGDPCVLSALPIPEPGPEQPWKSYHERPGRFGPHNIHEHRAGSFISETLVFVTYFNAGLRLYDISDARSPHEVAHFVPPTLPDQAAPQLNDLFVAADGITYVTDRESGGVYILEPTF